MCSGLRLASQSHNFLTISSLTNCLFNELNQTHSDLNTVYTDLTTLQREKNHLTKAKEFWAAKAEEGIYPKIMQVEHWSPSLTSWQVRGVGTTQALQAMASPVFYHKGRKVEGKLKEWLNLGKWHFIVVFLFLRMYLQFHTNQMLVYMTSYVLIS